MNVEDTPRAWGKSPQSSPSEKRQKVNTINTIYNFSSYSDFGDFCKKTGMQPDQAAEYLLKQCRERGLL